jgi:hypothetical protein
MEGEKGGRSVVNMNMKEGGDEGRKEGRDEGRKEGKKG